MGEREKETETYGNVLFNDAFNIELKKKTERREVR